MKTKSYSLFHVLSQRVLVTVLPQTRYVAAVLLMLVAVLLTGYSTIANTGRGGRQGPTSTAGIYPAEDDQDLEYREKRDEFLRGFFGNGPGGVLPSAYTSALALPPSLLLQGRGFAASFAGVFASTNGGLTWGNMTDGIPAGMIVSGPYFNPTSRHLAASTYGRGVYIFHLGAPATASTNSSANLATTSGL